jgi:hypothetical protein
VTPYLRFALTLYSPKGLTEIDVQPAAVASDLVTIGWTLNMTSWVHAGLQRSTEEELITRR